MKILATIVLTVSSAVSAGQTRVVDGNYLRYEGTQYDSIFLPCLGTEVWAINGGIALDALVDYYRHVTTVASGEIRTTLMLNVEPVDRAEHPGSQIDSVAEVFAILSISEAENEIRSCRDE